MNALRGHHGGHEGHEGHEGQDMNVPLRPPCPPWSFSVEETPMLQNVIAGRGDASFVSFVSFVVIQPWKNPDAAR
jgi:hypothetical protein